MLREHADDRRGPVQEHLVPVPRRTVDGQEPGSQRVGDAERLQVHVEGREKAKGPSVEMVEVGDRGPLQERGPGVVSRKQRRFEKKLLLRRGEEGRARPRRHGPARQRAS